MAVFYHGSSVLFDRFDLAHVLKGTGKVKFGYGVYLTSSYSSAAHYSVSDKEAERHYVYTVEVPDITDTNHIDFKKPVHPDIIGKTEERLDMTVPDKVKSDGKDFRKFLAKYFEDHVLTDLAAGASGKKALQLAGEREASGFLSRIGVDFITWPYSWKNPESGTNVAVLDESRIRILKIEEVELDARQKLIKGSEKEVRI